MEVTHSPTYREVLIVSGVSILNDSVFRKVFKVQVQDRPPPVVGFGYQK